MNDYGSIDFSRIPFEPRVRKSEGLIRVGCDCILQWHHSVNFFLQTMAYERSVLKSNVVVVCFIALYYHQNAVSIITGSCNVVFTQSDIFSL